MLSSMFAFVILIYLYLLSNKPNFLPSFCVYKDRENNVVPIQYIEEYRFRPIYTTSPVLFIYINI